MTKYLLFMWLIVLAAVAQGADVSGRWTGTIDIKDESSGTEITTKVKFQLVQSGGTISGTVGRQEDAELIPIKNVIVDGNKITFEASNGETSKPVKFILQMVDNDRMEGEMKTVLDTDELTGKIKISRVKS